MRWRMTKVAAEDAGCSGDAGDASRRSPSFRFAGHASLARILPPAVLCSFFVVLFRDALFRGRFLLVGDPLKQFYPLRTMIWAEIREGNLPLWIPHILSGYPASAMAMLGLCYPLTWGYLFLPGWWAEQLYVLAPYFLAPIFTYAFLREWNRSREAAVLGALTFGYGGFLFSPIGLTGVHANSALWLPLVLLGIARSRRRPLFASLTIATAGYTLSILAGSGQVFLYLGGLAVAFGAFLAVFPEVGLQGSRWRRCYPLITAITAIAISAGLTAFQMFETWGAVHQSVREGYPASRVAEGSFSSMLAVRSLLQPLGNFWDCSTFVPLIALLPAIAALVLARRSPQVHFWTFIAVISWVLVLGSNTAVFDYYSQLPFVGRFRFPSRHSMEWSFAIGVLASYGWDAIEQRVAAWRGRHETAQKAMVPLACAATFLLLSGVFAIAWQRVTITAGLDVVRDINNSISTIHPAYLAWKVAFTTSTALAIFFLWRTPRGAWRNALLLTAVAFGCFVEPHIWMVRPVIVPYSAPRALFGTTAAATHVAKKHLAPNQRTFSVPHPYAVSSDPVREVDAVNWTALHGLEDANGYESLILARYSRVMTGSVDTEPFVYPDRKLLDPRSKVLDLLSVGCVISYADFQASLGPRISKDGVLYSTADLAVDVKSDGPYTFPAADAEADSLFIVTTLGNAGDVMQGEEVARVSVVTTDGRNIEFPLLAGVHTAEFSHERGDVAPNVRHQLAPLFDSSPGDAANTFKNHRFLAKLDLGARVRVDRVEVWKTAPRGGVGLWKATLHDSSSGASTTLPQPAKERWQTVHDRNGVVVLKNLRALPRAWLVPRVEILDETEILRRIRGESDVSFDPQAVALLEPDNGKGAIRALKPFATATPPPLAPLPPVRIEARDGRHVVLRTDSDRHAMLVVSEIHYPGWVATIDGRRAPVHRTNFFLRGVSVPPGPHTVVMKYTAPALRRGGRVSIATLLLVLAAASFRRVRSV